jgi:hypothetical protein
MLSCLVEAFSKIADAPRIVNDPRKQRMDRTEEPGGRRPAGRKKERQDGGDTRMEAMESAGKPHHRLEPLPLRQTRHALTLAACAGRLGVRDAAAIHRLLAELQKQPADGDPELMSRLEEASQTAHTSAGRSIRNRRSIDPKLFDRARRWADQRIEAEVYAVRLKPPAPPGTDETCGTCPQVLFCRGSTPASMQWAGFFNSRKPRRVPPDARWLRALRHLLEEARLRGEGFVSSIGTTTYELVCGYATRHRLPLLRILPFAMDAAPTAASRQPGSDNPFPGDLDLSCCAGEVTCPDKVRKVCRDRLAAWLSDRHVAIELRRNGNLQNVLERQRSLEPRPLTVFEPVRTGADCAGNRRLAETAAPDTVHRVPETSLHPADSPAAPEVPLGAAIHPDPAGIDWNRYLYHYTRACPGPWPGQSREEYLYSLLDGDPLCGHGPIDTLIRILKEGRIRGGSRMVRGEEPVVAWTARPPLELAEIRRWNRGLLRWTFEPFGIAVDRRIVRARGAKPAVYAREALYGKIKPGERYRFQPHEPPHRVWKQEREYRILGDFHLDGLKAGEAFVVVANPEDAGRIAAHCGAALPVYTLQP